MQKTKLLFTSLILLILIYRCSLPTQTEARTITIDGHISRALNNEPINGASIKILEICNDNPDNIRIVTTVRTTSKSDGFYSCTFSLNKFCKLSRLKICASVLGTSSKVRENLHARSQTVDFRF